MWWGEGGGVKVVEREFAEGGGNGSEIGGGRPGKVQAIRLRFRQPG